MLAQSVADAGRIDCVPAWRRWRFLVGIIMSLVKTTWKKGIWFAGVGTVLTVLALFLIAGWNNSSLLSILGRSTEFTHDPQQLFKLLHVEGNELRFILIPFVLAYIFYAWRALDLHKIDSDEVKSNDHAY